MSAFKKAGMWLPNVKVVLNKIKKYFDLVELLPLLITDKNVLDSTPKSISYTLQAREAWK
jgi:hypothetical protein